MTATATLAQDTTRAAGPARATRARGRPGTVALPLADLTALGVAVAVSGTAGWASVAYLVAVFAVLACRGTQRPRICPRVSDQVPWLVGAVVLALPVLLPATSAVAALRLCGWSALFVVGGRLALGWCYRTARGHGIGLRSALVVGADPVGLLVAGLLANRPEFGLRPIGFLDRRPAADVLGAPEDVVAVADRLGVRQVIVCFPEGDLVAALRAAVSARLDVRVVPRLTELGVAVPRACLDEVWGVPLVPLRRHGGHRAAAKRAVDLVLGGLLLVVTAPVLAVLAAAVALTSGRPVLFRQRRLTGAGRTTEIRKLRTLPVHADADTRWAVPPGATRLGRWLRATHSDELPQLLDVVRGDMSLVGPRPERPYFAAHFAGSVPHYAGRHRMPAGITGWAQVHGLHGDTSMADRVRFDNQYVEYWTPWLDLVVLVRTLASPWHRGGRS
jgi:lipopolysaccharide/colanic/teichoic acid biosynthesis glycosyltransferase